MWKPRARPVGERSGRYGVEYRYVCPRCRQDNLWWVVRESKGACWTCRSRGWKWKHNRESMAELFGEGYDVSEVDALVADLNAGLLGGQVTVYPAPEPPQDIQTGLESWGARLYLQRERRCELDELQRAGVWYSERDNRVHFPLTRCFGGTGAGGVVPTMSRTCSRDVKDWRVLPRSAAKEQYWFHPVELATTSLVLVEGPFDVLSSGLLGHAIALCGTSLTEAAEYSLHAMRPDGIFIWLDPDSPGKAAAKRIYKALVGCFPTVELIDHETEPGDLSREDCRKVLEDRGFAFPSNSGLALPQ